MPATWAEVIRDLNAAGSPHDDIAIDAGAYYMAKLRRAWTRERPPFERHVLAQASYNAGLGNILKAQSLCGDALLWAAVRGCLHLVTGPRNADETRRYVDLIKRWRRELELLQ